MKKLSDLEYLKLNKLQQLWYNIVMFICSIPHWIAGNCVKGCRKIVQLGIGIKDFFVDLVRTFIKGNWAVKLSYFIFGFGNLHYGQILRGVFFLLFELVFIFYMFVPINGTGMGTGVYYLQKSHIMQYGSTVGDQAAEKVPVEIPGVTEITGIYGEEIKYHDDSSLVLLYALLTIMFIGAFILTWYMQIKQCKTCMEITARGKRVKSGKQDLQSLVDDQFHKTLLALPTMGILFFTVLPIIFMMLIAFTNYDFEHDGYMNLFTWVGLDNFNMLLDFEKGGFGMAFGEVLSWTLIWAFFATFSNYFLGMLVAMMINKKGIRIKKFWRTVLVMTIAIPQFVSLLYVSKMFSSTGIIGSVLDDIPFIHNYLETNKYISLWDSPTMAKVLVIVINIWIGIPHIMLMATGILMNIPQDLYESSKIDGATGFQQYMKITLPYMLFVTGPYLLTSFVGNLNNFNVIYLLSGGNPLNTEIGSLGGVTVGHTDLLITWLFKLTVDSDDKPYYLASIVGILVFVVVAVLSLVVYNVIPSTKNEEDFK